MTMKKKSKHGRGSHPPSGTGEPAADLHLGMNDQIEASEESGSGELADVVTDILEDLHEQVMIQLGEARRQNEGPRIIAILEILRKLTDPQGEDESESCEHLHVEQGTCSDCGALVVPVPNPATPVAMLDPASCPHANINPFGVCRDCMTCLHQYRAADGTCHQCGQKADLEPPEASPDLQQEEHEQ